MNLNWIKSTKGEWLNLQRVNLQPVSATGVYIIWHGGDQPDVVRVGQGDIAERLEVHRNDPTITRHARNGGLYVTWASVASHLLDGVERYLADFWRPLEGSRFPDAVPIAVNSPFE